jgi:hypothetical protein
MDLVESESAVLDEGESAGAWLVVTMEELVCRLNLWKKKYIKYMKEC